MFQVLPNDIGISFSSAYQEKPIAYYPDGSTKWTSYTIKTDSETVEINKADKYDGFDGIKTNETENEITVDNGKFKAVFPKQRFGLDRKLLTVM